MTFKELKDRFFFYISVPKCVGCKVRLSKNDLALCPDCMVKYREIKKRNCSLCAKTLDLCSCTNKYLDSHYVHKLIKVFRYVQRDEAPSNNLIYSLKRDNRKDVLEFVTNELSASLESSVSDLQQCVFINVPRRRAEAAKYGLDHAQLLAKSLAKRFSAKYYQPLIPKSKRAQKKTEGSERIKNAQFALKRTAIDLREKTVIIIDDIVTTGASMGACASLIRALYPKKIIGATVSIAYKDPYIPFSKEDRFLPYKQ